MTAPHVIAEPRNTRRGMFWIAGERVDHQGEEVQRGQAFVEWEAPAESTGKLPVILIHGGGGQGTQWIINPDGGPGWAPLLVDRGHPVYVIDRPGYGRAAANPALYGSWTEPFGYASARWLFSVAPEGARHGWPWGADGGDAAFDTIVASSGSLILDTRLSNRLDGDRVTDLLDVLGPSILIAASAGGPAAYLAADRRPDAVAAVVGVETLGPAFKDLGRRGSLEWGLAAAPLAYHPPAESATDLRTTIARSGESNPAGNPLVLQEEPARTLVNLRRVPVGIFSTDVSGRHIDDEYTVAFLKQAGVPAEHLAFATEGVSGHGHGIAFENGNEAALDIVLEWLDTKLGRRGGASEAPAARGSGA